MNIVPEDCFYTYILREVPSVVCKQLTLPPNPYFYLFNFYPKGSVTWLIWKGCIVFAMIALLYGSKSGWTDFAKVGFFWLLTVPPPPPPQLLGAHLANQLV